MGTIYQEARTERRRHPPRVQGRGRGGRGRPARVLGIISADSDNGQSLVSSCSGSLVRANVPRHFLYERDILGCLDNAVALRIGTRIINVDYSKWEGAAVLAGLDPDRYQSNIFKFPNVN